MFPDRQWNGSGLQKLIRKIDETGNADRRPGSDQPHTACRATKIEDCLLYTSDAADE